MEIIQRSFFLAVWTQYQIIDYTKINPNIIIIPVYRKRIKINFFLRLFSYAPTKPFIQLYNSPILFKKLVLETGTDIPRTHIRSPQRRIHVRATTSLNDSRREREGEKSVERIKSVKLCTTCENP